MQTNKIIYLCDKIDLNTNTCNGWLIVDLQQLTSGTYTNLFIICFIFLFVCSLAFLSYFKNDKK